MEKQTIETQLIDSTGFITQTIQPQDRELIRSAFVVKDFGLPNDYMEAHFYDPNDQLLGSNYDYSNYTVDLTSDSSALYNQIKVNPAFDLIQSGFMNGQMNVIYQFYRKLFSSSPLVKFFIKEISPSRTELRAVTNDISSDQLQQDFLRYINDTNSSNFYYDFYLNLGDNRTLIGVNIALETGATIPTLLIKLYEPLPGDIDEKTQFWIVQPISEPVTYNVDIGFEGTPDVIQNQLRGPNITIGLSEKANLTTPYYNLNSIQSTEISSSFQQLLSLLQENSVDVNVDYSSFNNFIHFSSAEYRLENFKYKLTLVESYQNDIGQLNGLTNVGFISQSKVTLQGKIDELIRNFDDYEYYLYYDSSSYSWPKSNTQQPFINYSVTSSTALTWFDNQIATASLYDQNNRNYFWNNLPSYIVEDSQNAIMQTFMAMLGQHYDYLWTYTKALTDIHDADNRLNYGISKDLVGTALTNFGIKLYTNSNNTDDIYTSLFGITPSGSLLPSTGSYLITNYVTASAQTTPPEDITAETYKRLYHNLPYLLKTKGTYNGLRALMNCFGIPETILRIYEYGGSNKDYPAVEQYFERFNYGLDTKGVGTVDVPWLPVLSQFIDTGKEIVPDALEFRFKTDIPLSASFTQPLFQVGDTDQGSFQFGIKLSYSQSYNNTISQSINVPGSPFYGQYLGENNFNDWGLMQFVIRSTSGVYQYSNPIYLPFFNNEWWNLMLYRETGSVTRTLASNANTYTLVAKNSIYDGSDGTSVGYQGSSSMYIGVNSASFNNAWNNYSANSGSSLTNLTGSYKFHAHIGGDPTSSFNILGSDGVVFNGQIQEFRYWRWTNSITPTNFNNHVLDPMSFEANTYTSSYKELVYRLALGNMPDPTFVNYANTNAIGDYNNPASTYVGSQYNFYYSVGYDNSIHPTITGSVAPTGSFIYRFISSSVTPAQSSNIYGITPISTSLDASIYNDPNSLYSASGVINGNVVNNVYVISACRYNNFQPDSTIPNTYYSLLNPPNVGAISRVQDKVRIISQSVAPGNTLSPFVTTVLPPTNSFSNDLNYLDVSVSPQNSIDDDIIYQLGYFNIDDFIGNPADQYLTSYPGLTLLRNFYFQKYYNKANLFDTIKLLSYFDNALFKMIKDWAPARASLSTGLVIRPHILERNKTQRFEPLVYTGSNFSQSIDMEEIDGGPGMGNAALTLSTTFIGIYDTISGSVYVSQSDKSPLYTGEYDGTEIVVYTQPTGNIVQERNKIDVSSSQAIFETYSVLPFLPTLNNVSESRLYTFQMDVDYNYAVGNNPSIPVNNGYIVSRSLGQLSAASSSFLDSDVPESNYTVKRIIDPRYNGSKLIGALYNTYSAGDISYGDAPVINNNSILFAYFKEVTGTGSCMALTSSSPNNPSYPYISNTYIKYLIDAESNVLELTRANKNIFSVQDVFNKKQGDISLFDNQLLSNQKFLDGLKNIYAGGFKFTPSLYNPYGESTLVYNLTSSVVTTVPAAGETGITSSTYAPSYVIVPAQPGILSSGQLFGNSGYNYWAGATGNFYPTFSIQRTGALLSAPYLDKNINVYIEFTGSFYFSVNLTDRGTGGGVDTHAMIVYGAYTLDNVSTSSTQDTNAFANGQFYGNTQIVIPANNTSPVDFVGDGVTVNVYAENGWAIYGNPNASAGVQGRSLGFYNGGGAGNAFALTQQATSQITQIVSGAIDQGFGSGVFFQRDTGSYNIITASVSMSYWQGAFVQSASIQMVSGGYERIEEPFVIKQGDLFRFYDDESNQFSTTFEREVKRIYTPTQNQVLYVTQSMIIEFDEQVDPRACSDYNGSNQDSCKNISKFIIMRKIPDETNITLNYQKQPGATSDGIIIPDDAPASLRAEAGNIVKQLKAQNLI